MTEAYLHYIWQNRLFELHDLKSTSGDAVEIINSGFHNSNAGPDFLEGRIKVGEEEWAGHIEVHVVASEWYQHAHHADQAYDNVILHVVYENDKPARTYSGYTIPTIELKNRFDEMGYWRYEQFVSAKQFIPCATQLQAIDTIHKTSLIDRCMVERLEDKSSFVMDVLERTNGDWSEAFYRILFYAFGLKVNAEAMLLMAERLPERLLRKHQNNSLQIEALVFGVSGLLNGEEDYATKLRNEFAFLTKKYGLQPMSHSMLKFARMRPAGFPTLRLAQLIEVLKRHQNIFRLFVESDDLSECKRALKIDLPKYWDNHYRFGTESKSKSKVVSDQFTEIILINAIIPTVYHYGRILSKPHLMDRAQRWLMELKPEKNSIVSSMSDLGFSIQSANDSQGALQLYNTHCRLRKCLSCAIGVKLLKQ